MTKMMALAGAVLIAGLSACGSGSSAPGAALPAGQPQTISTAAITTASTNTSTSDGPIAGDPLPTVAVGQTATFTTCVPVFDDLSYTGPGGDWLQTGCVSSAALGTGEWVVNGKASLDCILRYDSATNDVVLFFCSGNPFV